MRRYDKFGKYVGVRKKKLKISFKYVTNTLHYGDIRCHTTKGSQNFVNAYKLDIGYATCK